MTLTATLIAGAVSANSVQAAPAGLVATISATAAKGAAVAATVTTLHQVRTVTSAEAMKAIMAEAAKRQPEIAARMPKTEYTDSTSTETHENIVVNQKFSAADFAR